MSLLKRLLHIMILLPLLASYSLAQEEEGIHNLTVNSNFYAHTTKRTNIPKNIQVSFDSHEFQQAGLIPKGSQAEFLGSALTTNGQYALKVRITKVAGNLSGKVVKKNDIVWVPYNPENSDITFRDKSGYEIQDAESSLSPNGASGDPNLAKNSDRTKTEADFCATGTCVSKSPAEKHRDTLGDFIKTLLATENQDPEDQWADDPRIAKYTHSREVQATIDRGMKFKRDKSTGKCWRFTKLAMREKRSDRSRPSDYTPGDLVDTYPVGTHPSKTGIAAMKKQGWVNLLDEPKYKNMIKSAENAPKGALLIYENTRDRRHPGHAEFKTDHGQKGGYVSDFYRSVDEPLYARKLIGVMIKEDI
ncbi:hypothetical protein D3C87_162240 [compost metagenome]